MKAVFYQHKMSKRKRTSKRPATHQELKGFQIQINEFGQIESTFGIDKINTFLNEHVEDRKLNEKPEDSSDQEEE